MDPDKINKLLKGVKSRQYRVHSGEDVRIELPTIPMTAETEFIELRTQSEGDDCMQETLTEAEEGTSRKEIAGKASKVGKRKYTIKAFDVLTQKEIEGVEQLEIEIEVIE